ncbi:MAG: hypothetical protein VW338_17525 [Rhodospirillaceae bacterium]
MSCGAGDDHCCYIDGVACLYLEEGTVAGRRWACGLLRALGSWAAVESSPQYQADVQPMWSRRGGGGCATYPAGKTCAVCGQRDTGQ